jgi:hypothetical protein
LEDILLMVNITRLKHQKGGFARINTWAIEQKSFVDPANGTLGSMSLKVPGSLPKCCRWNRMTVKLVAMVLAPLLCQNLYGLELAREQEFIRCALRRLS